MIFKLICHVTLFVADLVLTKWIPLKETVHYLEIKSAIKSHQAGLVKKDGKSEDESLDEEVILLA